MSNENQKPATPDTKAQPAPQQNQGDGKPSTEKPSNTQQK
jgi:hypothetical protein